MGITHEKIMKFETNTFNFEDYEINRFQMN